MVEGKIEIYLSYKEPEFKDRTMWLRPYLDREGFELLYYGANGWTVFVPCHPSPPKPAPKGKPRRKPPVIEPPVEEEGRIASCGCSN